MTVKLLAATSIAVTFAAMASGCGGIGDSSPTPTSVIMVDSSGSTRHLIREFKPAIKDAICRTASAEGKVWAAGGDAAVLANSTWTIDGKEFNVGDEGDELKKLDLQALCVKEASSTEAASLVAMPHRQGSDLVGLVKMAADVLAAHPDGPRSLLFLTDGGINALGVDLFKSPPKTPDASDQLIKRFSGQGLISPNSLTGGKGSPVKVWLCGVGRGATGNGGLNANYVQQFWKQMIEYAGGTVVTSAPSCTNVEGFAS